MILYLMQHGEATSKDEDPERPLTDRGREEAGRVARHAASLCPSALSIYHSGKLRAQQTAAILAEAVESGREPEFMEGIAPMDDPAMAKAAVEESAGRAGSAETWALVGHLPHLSRLASLLLTGDPSTEPLAFCVGSRVRLDNEAGSWQVRWMITPEIASAAY